MARPRKDIIRVHLTILESQNQILKHIAKQYHTSVSKILQTLIFNFTENNPILNPTQNLNSNSDSEKSNQYNPTNQINLGW